MCAYGFLGQSRKHVKCAEKECTRWKSNCEGRVCSVCNEWRCTNHRKVHSHDQPCSVESTCSSHEAIRPTSTLLPSAEKVEKRALAHMLPVASVTYKHAEKVHGIPHNTMTRWKNRSSFDDAPHTGRSVDENEKIKRVAAILATHSIRGASLITG